MKITVGLLFNLKDVFGDVISDDSGFRKLPFKIAYKLHKFIKDISRELETIEPKRVQILEKYCDRDGNKFNVESIKGEDQENFIGEWSQFLGEELDFEWTWEPFGVDDLDAVDINIAQLETLINAGIVKE